MSQAASKSAANRSAGKHQVDKQRTSILDAAEALFLQNGLENTRMLDIAKKAGINRVTLYRYFASRDEIAVQIQVRMMNRIAAIFPADDQSKPTLERHRRRAQVIIRNFHQLRDAYRYIGMFDKVYLDHEPGSALAQWTKAQLLAGSWGSRLDPGETPRLAPYEKELSVILSTITWFLEKLALRGELTWSDPSIPLEDHLQFFEEMILRAFDQLAEKKE